MLPFRADPTIDRLLKIEHELIGSTETKAFAGGILAEEQACVTGIKVMMVWPRQIVDLSETARKGVLRCRHNSAPVWRPVPQSGAAM